MKLSRLTISAMVCGLAGALIGSELADYFLLAPNFGTPITILFAAAGGLCSRYLPQRFGGFGAN